MPRGWFGDKDKHSDAARIGHDRTNRVKEARFNYAIRVGKARQRFGAVVSLRHLFDAWDLKDAAHAHNRKRSQSRRHRKRSR